MKRRKFLKILGTTSIIVAAGGGTAGYFLSEPGVDYPDEPWHTAGSLYQDPRENSGTLLTELTNSFVKHPEGDHWNSPEYHLQTENKASSCPLILETNLTYWLSNRPTQ
jgi:hypothetical protein